MAKQLFGAEYGTGEGMTGQCYALPTKGYKIEEIPLIEVKQYIRRFISYAKWSPDLNFLVTEVGCNLAGFTPEQIAPLFIDAIPLRNVYLPQSFINVLLSIK